MEHNLIDKLKSKIHFCKNKKMLLVLLSTEEIPSDDSDSDVCGLSDTVPGKTFCCCIV